MKRILITAGTVYGRLDDNKLVGNRIRGVWATKFAVYLHARGWSVDLLLPDTFDRRKLEEEMKYPPTVYVKADLDSETLPTFGVHYHNGYQQYADECYRLAPLCNGAVMAAAVVNWIPANPIEGKMKTEGYAENDVINVPFLLAPRVIDRMRKLNPALTLIGCKMTARARPEDTLRAAYQTLEKSHAHAIIGNDLSELKQKLLVYPDGAFTEFHLNTMRGPDLFFEALEHILLDKHYRTTKAIIGRPPVLSEVQQAVRRVDAIIDQYRTRFVGPPYLASDKVFGSLAVRCGEGFVVSPREKFSHWTGADCPYLSSVQGTTVVTLHGLKATLNAPLLVRMLRAHPEASAVLHLHEYLKDVPTLPHAPPGTVRDNDRELPSAKAFNIAGHGFVALLNEENEVLR